MPQLEISFPQTRKRRENFILKIILTWKTKKKNLRGIIKFGDLKLAEIEAKKIQNIEFPSVS